MSEMLKPPHLYWEYYLLIARLYHEGLFAQDIAFAKLMECLICQGYSTERAKIIVDYTMLGYKDK